MKKKVLIIVSIILLLNVATAYSATSLYGYFQGYEKVKVLVDGEEVNSKVPGFIIDGTTVLPLRAISEKMNAIVKWDDGLKTVSIIKPNVNMQFTANPIYDKDKKTYVVYSPFGKIPSNQRYNFTFYVYSEVDNLPKEKGSVKVVLKDPNGKIISERPSMTFDATRENSLQYVEKFQDITFIENGNYSVEFMLKSESTQNEFIQIGEKLILVK